MAEKRKLSERFRPEMLFTLDQIAYILRVSKGEIFNYVWTPYSKTPPKGRMQAIEIVDFRNRRDLRVSESQLDEWAKRSGYSALHHFI